MRAFRAAYLVFLIAGYALLPRAAIGVESGSVSPRIPLCAGLTIVGAVNEPQGDYEPILQIESIDDRAVHAKYSTNTMVGGVVRHLTVSSHRSARRI